MKTTTTLASLNRMAAGPFTKYLAEVFEGSPWIPERAWAERPFADIDALHAAMIAVVKTASAPEQLSLLRAHPQLAGKKAQAGTLTVLSAREQKGVGLVDLLPQEQQQVQQLNADYQEKFGFPFIIAVRERTKRGIFAEWQRRLGNSVAAEHQNALEQVFTIARLRLEDLLGSAASAGNEGTQMGKLSTHVLDTARGTPAAGVRVDFRVRSDEHGFQLLKTVHTNSDGRTDEPLMEQGSLQPGEYELIFYVGDYFAANRGSPSDEGQPEGVQPDDSLSKQRFLDRVPVRFQVNDAQQNYHVPLLVSPWSYTTYRGS